MKFLYLPLIFLSSIFTQNYKITTNNVKIYAKAELLYIDEEFTINGNGLSGYIDLNSKTMMFSYDLWNLKTGIELRDEHMHMNYLETEDHSTATFKGNIEQFHPDSLTANGEFTLHGTSKNISVKGSFKNMKLQAVLYLRLSDYKIDIPRKFLVAKLSEVLEIHIYAKLSE